MPFPFLCRHSIAFFSHFFVCWLFSTYALLMVAHIIISSVSYYNWKKSTGKKINYSVRDGEIQWKKTKLASQLISVAQINCRVAKNENNWRIRRKMVHMTLGKSKMGERQCMNRDRETELRFTTLELKYIYTLSNFKHEQETHNR